MHKTEAPPAISLAGLPMRQLSDILTGDHDSPDWFIEGLIPQGCFLIVGRPKIGKSWLNLQIAMTLACGGQFMGHTALGAFDVLYIAAEDDPGRIAMRFQKYRSNEAPANLKFICRDDLSRLAAKYAENYSIAEFIDGMLCENPKIKALIIDTESTVRAVWDGGSVRRDMSVTRNDYAEVREFDEIAHRRRVWIGLVNHTAKRRTAAWIDIHELINRTNTALAGASGSIVLADPPYADNRRDRCKVLGIRGRDIIDEQLLAVHQDEFAIFHSLGPYSEHQQTETEVEILTALEAMAETEPEAWQTSKKLAVYLSKNTGAVQRAVTRMIRAHRITWRGKNGSWNVETLQKKGIRLIAKAES